MNKGRILVIDDEEIIRESCRRVLEPAGYQVDTAASGGEGLQVLKTEAIDLVLTDLKMPDIDGIEVLIKIKENWPDTEVIIMTGYGTVKNAVKAMKMGVFDYIEKPFSPDDLLALVVRALNRQKLSSGEVTHREIIPSHYELGNIVGISQAMQKIFQLIARVASTGSTVLITGESGTGKELIARAIHYNSPRKDLPFVVVDCTTIPETLIESELFGHVKGAFTGASETKKGLLEIANGGTIFLDEIGNLNISTQAKLLRVLQEREFRPIGEKKTVHIDVRFISATNKDLRIMTKEGSFREDLFYRLNIFPIHMPPLRDRKEDIPHLAQYFLGKYREELNNRVTHINAEAMRLLVLYPWPGNVRQLENAIQRAVIMCQDRTLKPEHLTSLDFPTEEAIPRNSEELKEMKKDLRIKSVEGVEKAFIMEALRRNDWNISRASTDVGMQRTNFHSLMKKYRISAKAAEAE
ncbi:Acetoacetate metabolism regulatory protein AtoC [Candidatus Sulfobium mesophilum]|uniref:Acetoacetate metabolism regulatory protein AtoC n=1 Tax=Candidatus Sulfobium mesophilum TaxID=2016548 RepID=A0A2U3QF22_9BACT|nr:Acetoacetate metabolism regulatory protein AtoC [Candidatus Sulfobium mesophilum]